MIKGYYIHFDGRKSIGICKKIDMQMKELRKFFDIDEIEINALDRNLFQRIYGLLPWCSIPRNYEAAMNRISNPQFIYIRRTIADFAYIRLLKNIRTNYPKCKIIVEIFTYPYDRDEFYKWDAWPFYFKELLNRRKLKKYVDVFVTHSREKSIFHIPTIHTTNGIIVEDVDPVTSINEKKDNSIIMIAVAFMQKHHGYERIIKGLHHYYKAGGKRNVQLWLVGDGPERKKYIQMVKGMRIDNYVKFFDTVVCEKLDELYNQADIALGAFGCYKDHVYFVSTIKVKEYMAKGIPIVNGCKEEMFEHDDIEYYLNVPNDVSTVDIEKIIKFYDNLYRIKTKEQLINEMRREAIRTVDMSVTLKPIIQYIKNETGESGE